MAGELEVQDRISKLDIEDFVQNATWRELLMELVENQKLDPWDINISEMLDAYVEVIRKMKVLDLRVPANIILAASILLRLKSESLAMQYEEEEEIAEDQERAPRPEVDVPNLVTKARVQPGRKITLQELIEALDTAMKSEEKRRKYTEEIQMPISITMVDDIDSRIDNVRSLIMSGKDSMGMTTYSSLERNFDTMENKLLGLFVPLLFLTQSEVITLTQEEFFGDIIVRLIEHGKGAAKA